MPPAAIHALALTAPKTLGFVKLNPPTPADGEVVVAPLYVGICGTDKELVSGRAKRGRYPLVLGHEWVGKVVRVGAGAPPSLIGSTVVGENVVRGGAAGTLEIGFELPGALADEFAIPARLLHVVPPEIDARDAVLAEPTAVAAHVVERLGLDSSRLVVIGDGPIALLVSLLAIDRGWHVTMLGKSADNIAVAAAAGVSETLLLDASPLAVTPSFPAVIEASGTGDGLEQALEICSEGGVLVLAGSYDSGEAIVAAPLVHANLRLEGVNTGCGYWEPALEAIAKGVVGSRVLRCDVVDMTSAPARVLEEVRRSHSLKLVIDRREGRWG